MTACSRDREKPAKRDLFVEAHQEGERHDDTEGQRRERIERLHLLFAEALHARLRQIRMRRDEVDDNRDGIREVGENRGADADSHDQDDRLASQPHRPPRLGARSYGQRDHGEYDGGMHGHVDDHEPGARAGERSRSGEQPSDHSEAADQQREERCRERRRATRQLVSERHVYLALFLAFSSASFRRCSIRFFTAA